MIDRLTKSLARQTAIQSPDYPIRDALRRCQAELSVIHCWFSPAEARRYKKHLASAGPAMRSCYKGGMCRKL